ncbi:cytochrome P450 [Actinoplanes oblitus]|uniref:Cytochrome P450 n=1 Tax=Actinoplanes oblitus TaxID=3040509 RepID=A0ABY8W9P1_9ACTN|nr:cytochrome P450 [Actinoplanes oblitus]WIM94388.1 cytochrome P450 [Actinoplanes oblitus]
MSVLEALRRDAGIRARRAGGWLVARSGDEVARLAYRPWQDDPYPVYARLRRGGELGRSRTGIRAATGYRICDEILRDRRFGVQFTDGDVGGTRGLGFPPEHQPRPSLLQLDPPAHTRLRAVAHACFTATKVAGYRPMVERITERLLAAAATRDDFDLMADFAAPLPISVICELLGVPDVDTGRFAHYGRVLTTALGGVRSRRHADDIVEATTALDGVLERLIAERTEAPGDDVISALVRAAGADRLSADEVLATAELLLVAGFETTTHLIGNGVHALLRRPDQWAALVADPELAPAVVTEALRFDPPVQFTQRIVQERLELRGEALDPDTMVLILLGSANRDPEVFEDPDRFDLGRSRAVDPLAFGSGIHYCLGALLARLEGEVAFAALPRVLPRLEAAGAPRRGDSPVIRGFRSLPVRSRPVRRPSASKPAAAPGRG